MKSISSYRHTHKLLLFMILSLVSITGIVHATVNTNELFPNGSSILQSKVNGWTTPTSGSGKEVYIPDGTCRKITSLQASMMFVPTHSQAEWDSFVAHLPSGVSIGNCDTYCTAGGMVNCITLPPGYTYSWYQSGWGTCSLTCGGGSQSQTVTCKRNDNTVVADSYCTTPKPTSNQACNTQACAVNGSCGGSANTCTSGSPSGYSAGSCGGSQTWSCVGANGGSTASCNIVNAVCPQSCSAHPVDPNNCGVMIGWQSGVAWVGYQGQPYCYPSGQTIIVTDGYGGMCLVTAQ